MIKEHFCLNLHFTCYFTIFIEMLNSNKDNSIKTTSELDTAKKNIPLWSLESEVDFYRIKLPSFIFIVEVDI